MANHIRDLTFNASRLVFEYSADMNAYLDGLSRMSENRLSPMIVQRSQVKKTFEQLVKNARAKGLEPVVNHWTELFNSDVSCFFRNGRLTAIIHVPLKSLDKMLLSKYINSPMRIGNVTFHVELEENIIAINQEETLVRVYREEELQECQVRNGFYHCPNSQVLSKALDKNCLYMLYKSNSYGIRASCDLKVSRTASGVVQLSSGTFLVHVEAPEKVDITCLNGTTYRIRVQTSQRIWVPSGCGATSGLFVMIHDHSIKMDSELVYIPLQINYEELIGQDWLKKFNVTQNEILDVLMQVQENLDKVKVPITSVKEKIAMLRVVQQAKVNSSRLSLLKVGLWLLLVVSFVIGVILIYYKFVCGKDLKCLNCTKCRKGRTSTKRRTPPEVPRTTERSRTIQRNEEGFYESVRMSELEA